MSRHARVIWTCDRCDREASATETELGFNGGKMPGWRDLEGQDLCPQCAETYRLWWARPEIVEVPP